MYVPLLQPALPHASAAVGLAEVQDTTWLSILFGVSWRGSCIQLAMLCMPESLAGCSTSGFPLTLLAALCSDGLQCCLCMLASFWGIYLGCGVLVISPHGVVIASSAGQH